jgi:hypothetical protein
MLSIIEKLDWWSYLKGCLYNMISYVLYFRGIYSTVNSTDSGRWMIKYIQRRIIFEVTRPIIRGSIYYVKKLITNVFGLLFSTLKHVILYIWAIFTNMVIFIK